MVKSKLEVLGFSTSIEQPLVPGKELVGTWKFIAPEMHLSQPCGVSSDFLSVGVIIYLFATQKFTFDVENSEGGEFSLNFLFYLKQKIPSEDPPPIESNFSRAFKEIVAAMLHKSPSLRPNADQLLKLIKKILRFQVFQQI
jgi:serine/threonine protein kinase